MNYKLKELPIEERIRLVEDLWDSIAADQNAIRLTDAQKEELERRLNAYKVDQNRGRPAAEVITDISRQL